MVGEGGSDQGDLAMFEWLGMHCSKVIAALNELKHALVVAEVVW